MKKYKLKKDLPLASKGTTVFFNNDGDLTTGEANSAIVSHRDYLPEDFSDWLEEIPEEKPKDFRAPPEEMMVYSAINDDTELERWVWYNNERDFIKYAYGLIVKDEIEMEQKLRYSTALFEVKKWIAKNCKPFEPEWRNKLKFKYYAYYDHRDRKFSWDSARYLQSSNLLPYLKSKEEVEKLIKKQEDNLKIIFGVEE
jgi:hypothetical protein